MKDPRTARQGTIREGRRGERLTARRFSEPIRALNRLQSGVGQAQQMARGSRQSATPAIARLTVISVGDDHLVCHGTSDETGYALSTVYVAKPYLLRRTPFDGLSRNGISYSYTSATARTADNGSTTEDQVIVPAYVAGDEIVAARGVSGGTGIALLNAAVPWLDINVDGRAWAKAAA